ncbi:MAG TPA: tail fiber domain-containing protein [Pyrinomonadaceae bacterium]|nr:tail fiber domain-containing protein [Pyrinomonadaceae bacterium]
MKSKIINLILTVAFIIAATFVASAQTTEFTYQGKMLDTGLAPTALYDLEFKLFDAATGGTQLGSTLTLTNVQVREGIFTVQLDFGANFPGSARFLEIAIKKPADVGFTLLTPRQSVTTVPYAVRSINTFSASRLSPACVNCVTAGQIESVNGSTVTSAIPVASVPSGSSNYIQNGTAQQASSNFNVSGTGTANIINATTQFNIGPARVLSMDGQFNLFVGQSSGFSITTGRNNIFVGQSAGFNNTTGNNNAFFGSGAGFANTTADNNAFFGFQAGSANSGASNAFFGALAGQSNTTGASNAFFGPLAGQSNTTGTSNAFFGSRAGFANTSANRNSFFGNSAGQSNTQGADNAFFGAFAGSANTTGGSNAFFGSSAGAHNTITFNNSFFGSKAGEATTASENSFFGSGAGQLNTVGTGNAFFGVSSGSRNIDGTHNSFFGSGSGFINTTGGSNAFFGDHAGDANTAGSNNSALGAGASFAANNLTFATAIGAGAIVTASNRIQLGRNGLDAVSIGRLAAGSSTPVCRNGNVLADCSSSRRYKENIAPYVSGLDLIERLQPVTFDWKDRKEHDLGLIAEEVAEAEPLLVTHNRSGEIQGVKYDQITVALINAVKEQQAQIEKQMAVSREQAATISRQEDEIADQTAINKNLQEQLKGQGTELEALMKLVCSQNPAAELCKQ